MKRFILIFSILAIMLTACNHTFSSDNSTKTVVSQQQTSLALTQTETSDPSTNPTDFQSMTDTPQPPTDTLTPSVTPTPQPTFTSTPYITPTWALVAAGKVVAPILLYHHVADIDPSNRYYMPPDVFDHQMRILHDWGYTSIPISTLVKALTQGGELPQRPVVISFDDGNLDVYTNAFPIMYMYGYVGTFYMIANRVGARDCVTADQLKEMAAAGWEIGSHSMTHIDLTQNHARLDQEIVNSRTRLENALGVQVRSFAYPFGTVDPTVADKVQEAGYLSAVGLGISTTHTMSSLYYLDREEVRSTYDDKAFEALLPWQGVP